MSETFDQAAYWKERHRKLRGDHRATGNASRSPQLMHQRKLVQAYFFSALVNALLAAARDPRSWLAKPDAPDGRQDVLDIGFGTGFLGSLLAPQGIPYTGYDLSEVAVEDATAMCSEARYMLHDIVRQPAQESSIVIASEVLFHIVDDAQWMDALGNISAGLRRDSAFFFTETFVTKMENGPPHFKPRTRKMYVEALAHHGLRFVRPDEIRLAAWPVFNQYAGFGSLHFVRRAESCAERMAYFHGGTHKTGTTTIQEFMRLNKAYLRKRGIARVVDDDVLLTNSGQQRAAHRVAETLAQGSKSRNWQAVKEAISAVPADMPIFLSSEQIFRHLTVVKSDAARASIIKNIKTALGEKVTFILYVRNIGEYVNSLASERIIATQDSRSLPDIVRSFHHLVDIQPVVEDLQAAFGPGSVRVHSFDAAVKAPGGLLSHFVQSLGHESQDMNRPNGRLHIMPPVHVLALKYRINSLGLDKSVYPRLRRQIGRIALLHPPGDNAFRIVDDATIDEAVAEGRRRNPGLVGLFPDDLSDEVLFSGRAKARPYVDIAQMDLGQMDIAEMSFAQTGLGQMDIERMFSELANSTLTETKRVKTLR